MLSPIPTARFSKPESWNAFKKPRSWDQGLTSCFSAINWYWRSLWAVLSKGNSEQDKEPPNQSSLYAKLLLFYLDKISCCAYVRFSFNRSRSSNQAIWFPNFISGRISGLSTTWVYCLGRIRSNSGLVWFDRIESVQSFLKAVTFLFLDYIIREEVTPGNLKSYYPVLLWHLQVCLHLLFGLIKELYWSSRISRLIGQQISSRNDKMHIMCFPLNWAKD